MANSTISNKNSLKSMREFQITLSNSVCCTLLSKLVIMRTNSVFASGCSIFAKNSAIKCFLKRSVMPNITCAMGSITVISPESDKESKAFLKTVSLESDNCAIHILNCSAFFIFAFCIFRQK